MTRKWSWGVPPSAPRHLPGWPVPNWRPGYTVLWFAAFAMLGSVLLTARTAQAQITFLSANGNTLTVSINCATVLVSPGPCGTVGWTSNVPGDTFSPPVSPTSGTTTAATASTTLILGPTPGPRTVTASTGLPLPGGGSVTFTVT